MEKAKIVVVGAGVVGLAVAARLSEECQDVYVLEKNKRFGQETSGHNSGVIHSGIHYPPKSLKAELCVKGNRMLYDLCEEHGVPFKRLGKLTVAIEDEEIEELERLMRQGEANGVEELRMIGKEEVRRLEPKVEVERALYSPTTGILEPDELMNHFYSEIQRHSGLFVPVTEVTSMKKVGDDYEVGGVSTDEKFTIRAEAVINCAGLYSDRVASMAGLDVDRLGYRLHWCKGDYFRLSGKPLVRMLVYPVPKGPGLGIHLTPDMAGGVRLGPNAYYVHDVSYEVESSEKEFRADVERFLPSIAEREIRADSAGVRPKLEGPGMGFKDFVIRHEADRGLFGLVNLVGIESPGLTASPAIAELVLRLYHDEIAK
ncbi:MAG: NAD(P)/FAD-dependent oxidoreductase [Candidatus Bathyarchaeia archaeon]|jgi:L-2-hydroxyglutarate oxidase LhgO